MVPNVNPRGFSFKGVALYLLHDKGADTSERVAWTSTHNLHTDDIEEAARFMAWTDLHRDQIKAANGNYHRGWEADAGNTYHLSNSYAPDENPSRERMEADGHASLAALGLSEHQYFFVAHEDTAHKHLHMVVNLVHPQTGRIHRPYNDYKVLDKWAHEHELEHGIKCENRAKKYEAWDDGRKAFKEKERREGYISKVNAAFHQSDNAKSFTAALKEDGLSLAQGKRRGFVVVDDRGEIYALKRLIQFDEELRSRDKTKAISARLEGVDKASLPIADEVAEKRKAAHQEKVQAEEAAKAKAEREQEERKQTESEEKQAKKPHFTAKQVAGKLREKEEPEIWDREQAERDALDKIENGGIELAKAQDAAEKAEKKAATAKAWGLEQREKKDPQWHHRRIANDHARQRKADFFDAKRREKIEEIKTFYKVDEREAELKEANADLDQKQGYIARVFGWTRAAEDHAEAMRLNYEDAQTKQQQAINAINKKYHYHPQEARQDRMQGHAQRHAETGQDKDQLGQVNAVQEQEAVALKEAESSPESAAQMAEVVAAKTPAQKGRVEAVKAKGRDYRNKKATQKKAAEKATQDAQERTREKAQAQHEQTDAQAQALRENVRSGVERYRASLREPEAPQETQAHAPRADIGRLRSDFSQRAAPEQDNKQEGEKIGTLRKAEDIGASEAHAPPKIGQLRAEFRENKAPEQDNRPEGDRIGTMRPEIAEKLSVKQSNASPAAPQESEGEAPSVRQHIDLE